MSALNYLPGGGVIGVKPHNISAYIEANKQFYNCGPTPLPKPNRIAHKKDAPPPIAKGEPLLQTNEYSASMSQYYQAKKALIEYVKKYEAKRQKVSKKASVHNYFETRMKQENKLVSDTLEIFGYTPAQIAQEKRAILRDITNLRGFNPTQEGRMLEGEASEMARQNVIIDRLASNPALTKALSSVGPIDEIVAGEQYNLPSRHALHSRMGTEPTGDPADNLSATYDYIIGKASGRIPKDAPKPANYASTVEHNADEQAINRHLDTVSEAGEQVGEEYMSSISRNIPEAPFRRIYDPRQITSRQQRGSILSEYVKKIIANNDKGLIDEVVGMSFPIDKRNGLPYSTRDAYTLLSYAGVPSTSVDRWYVALYNAGRLNDVLK